MKRKLHLLALFAGLIFFSFQANAQTYCDSALYTSGCGFGDDLDDVTIGSYVQTSTGCSTDAFADYTGDTITIAQSTPTAISISSNFSNQYYALWIDANSDGDFDDTGEFIWSTSVGAASANSTIIVPLSISTGTYRMRLRGRYSQSIPANGSCSVFTYGEIHDYTVNVTPPPPCPDPYGFTFSQVTDASAQVSFQSTNNLFYVEYGPCGFTQGTGMLDTVTSSTFTLSGLASNTEYEVFVKSDCSAGGNGSSSWASSGCFKTECAPQVGAVTENFDGTTAGSSTNPSPPNCWNYYESPGYPGYGYVRNGATYAHSGSNFFYMYTSNSTSSDTMMLISPAISDISTTDKRLEFWGRSYYSGTSYNATLVIGTVSSPGNPASFSPIDTVVIGGVSVYNYFSVDFTTANGYNGTDQYIAIMDASPTYNYPMIDDISIYDLPTCEPSTNLNVAAFTNNAGTINWTAGDGLSYELEYGITGFTQGTGAPMVTGISGTSYTITGLDDNTCYDVYVRDSCASGKSPWFGPVTFCTACDPVATPIAEGFENVPTGSSLNPTVPDCWKFWKNNAAPGYGYVYGWSTPNTGAQHFFMSNSNSMVDTLALISPAIQGLTNSDKMVKFYTTTNSTFTTGSVIVGTSSSPDVKNGTILDTFYAGSSYMEHTVYLDSASGYNGTDEYVFFMHSNVNTISGIPSTYISLYIDDVSIEDIPQCTPPWNLNASNITASGVDVDWASLYGTGFRLEYGPQGFIPGTGGNGIVVNNATSPTSISGLTPNTYYDVYVADNCDTTNFAGPLTFKTECLAQLSGTFTVGGATADFATLDSAMMVINGCGINGPVVLNLQGGVHMGSVAFNGVDGSSATNTITINGGGVGVDTLRPALGTAYGIWLSHTSYVEIKNVTIDAPNADRAVWIQESHHVAFDNCDIIGPASTLSSQNAFVVATSATSATSYGDKSHDIEVTNCNISGGYYSMVFTGANVSQTGRIENVRIENVNISNSYYYGIRFYYANNVTIEGCTVDGVVSTYGYGLYMYYGSNFTVEQNSFTGGYGAYFGQANNIAGGVSSNSTIANNFLKGTQNYGLYFSTAKYVSVFHNSMLGANRGAYMIGTCDTLDVRNNIFVGNSSEGIYYNGADDSYVLDYNVYYSNSGSNSAYWDGTGYATLSAWQTANSSYNSNSIFGDPGYISSTDLHIAGTLPNDVGDNTVGITTDIDGDTRPASGSTTVDIGADEFTPLNWDASILGAIVPLAGCGDSTTEVSLIVKNFGLNTITSLPVYADVAGGITANISSTATVSIAQGATDTVSVGTFNTYQGGNGVNFTLYVALANDQKLGNDTLMLGPGFYIPAEPATPTGIDTMCASVDSVDLYVNSGFDGLNYNWFDAAAGGNLVGQGDTVTVPTTGPTTYYVEYDSLVADVDVGTGTTASTSTTITPYKTFYMDGRVQYLVLASELNDMGVVGSGEISSLAFDVVSADPAVLTDFTIKMGNTSLSAMTGTYEPTTNMVTVFSQNDTVTQAGWKVHQFTTPFNWNGSDNVIIEICFDNSGWTGNSSVRYSSTTFASVNDGYTDNSTASGCTPGIITSSSAHSDRPNMRLGVKVAPCTFVRKPFSFAIYADTAIAAYTPSVNANGADVDFDASASTGHVYTWDFGDGSTGTGVTASHTYAQGDEYTVCLTVTDTVCNTTDSICQTVLATVGLDETLVTQTLNVFPNPNNGVFRVEFQVEGLKDVTLRVVTMLGQEVYESAPGKVSGQYREEINLNNQPAGVYLIQVILDNNVTTKRITIKK